MARIIFFVIDGFGDKPHKQTPLRLAFKPFLNSILNNIYLAQFLPLEKNYWPKLGNRSVTGLANLGILGYKLKPNLFKRGPFEAIGSDVLFKNGELALRVDFATVDENLKVIDRRAGRNFWKLKELVEEVNKKIKFDIPFSLYHTYGHRGVLIFRKKLSDQISDSDPYSIGKKVKKIKPLKKNKLSLKTAKIVWDFLIKVHQFLNTHPFNKLRIKKGVLPANFLLTREAGSRLPKLKNFFKKTKIKNGLVIAENGALKGGCKLVGFKTLTLPETEKIEKRYQFYWQGILNNFKNFELIYVHLKEADEFSHDKKPNKKKEFFEFFDKWFKNLYLRLKKESPIFVLTGDHLTDSFTGKHLWGSLPLIIINHPQLKNQPREISELEAKKQELVKPQKLWRLLIG
ncbi:hypothetical protein HRbin35_00616 [bacterium HR35]|nr:hypothetical protein HRbin35_00616 [bacterium HR35]